MAAPIVFENVVVTPKKGALKVTWKLGPGAVNGRAILAQAFLYPSSELVPASGLVMTTQQSLKPTATSVLLAAASGVPYEIYLTYVTGVSSTKGTPL